MSSNYLDICNQALLFVGASRIQSWDDGSLEGEICEQFYQSTVDELLTRKYWKFATKYKQLAQLNKQSISGYSKAYALPTDFLSVQGIDGVGVEYEIAEGVLYTNADNVNLKYTYAVDVNSWNPAFKLLVSYQLASIIANPVTSNTTKAEFYTTMAQKQMTVAVSMDSRQDTNEYRKTYRFLGVRY